MIFRFGDREVHIEEIPWYILTPACYFLVIALGVIFEQSPSLPMQRSARTFREGEPDCPIFGDVSLFYNSTDFNVTVRVSTHFPTSLTHAWRSIRVRLHNSLYTEILRSDDASSNWIFTNKTAIGISFKPSIGGDLFAEVFCGDKLLGSFTTSFSRTPPEGFDQAFFGESEITNVCVSSGRFEYFTPRVIVAPNFDQRLSTIIREPFVNRTIHDSMVYVTIKDLPLWNAVASLLYCFITTQQSCILVDGNQAVSWFLSKISHRFADPDGEPTCARVFNFVTQLRSCDDFDPAVSERIRALLPESDLEYRHPVIISLPGGPLEILDDLSNLTTFELDNLTAQILLYHFRNASRMILPFQAPHCLIQFIHTYTEVILVKPAGFPHQSELERRLPSAGLNYSIVYGQLIGGGECGDPESCVSEAKYRLDRLPP
jgi:hypothetical protein